MFWRLMNNKWTSIKYNDPVLLVLLVPLGPFLELQTLDPLQEWIWAWTWSSGRLMVTSQFMSTKLSWKCFPVKASGNFQRKSLLFSLIIQDCCTTFSLYIRLMTINTSPSVSIHGDLLHVKNMHKKCPSFVCLCLSLTVKTHQHHLYKQYIKRNFISFSL